MSREAATSPSVEEIEAIPVAKIIPKELLDRVISRYIEHSSEYITGVVSEKDGKPVNACMFNDNLVNVEEEIVDAVFNSLIFVLRHNGEKGGRLVGALAEAWAKVKFWQEQEKQNVL